MSNITLNIVEPGSPTPDPVVPNTGLFTSGIGGPEATAIGAVLILTIAAIVVAFLYRKQKKSGKVTKLVHLVDSTKAVLKSKKRVTAGLSAIALLASAGTLTTLLANAGKSNTNAVEEDGLTLDVTGGDITIEVADEPVFAVAEVKVTVKEATQAGYTLTAYTDNTDLVSTTDSSKVIPMITLPEAGGELSALTNNTYGLALEEEPTTKDAEVYMPLSTDSSTPTILKATDYVETEANDITTIYYGFYITPDVPYGTYTSSEISYEAKENAATVTFDGNGKFYFDGNASQSTNVAKYIPGAQGEAKYSHTPNVNDEGVQTEGEMYPLNSNETFVYEFGDVDNVYVEVVKTGNDSGCGPNQADYFSIWSGAYPDNTAKANWETALSLNGSNGKNVFDNDGKYDGVGVNIEGSAATIAYTTNDERQSYCPKSGYGYYAKVTGYNPNTLIFGEYEKPEPNGTYRFLGWSEDKDATTPTYTSREDIMRSLDLTKGDVTLYAISKPGIAVSYNGNGAGSTTDMDNVEQYTTDLESTEKRVDLLASNFKKDGYGFAGWSTDQDAASKINNTGDDKPTIYGPNQRITVDPSASTKLNLYAVWVPAETNVTMQTFNPNSEPYASKPNGTVIALKDERDEEVYAVAKLADGNYWMIENLRLDNEPELSAANTHNPSLPLTNNHEEQITSNKLSETSNNWCNDWNTTEEQIACYDHSNLNTNNVANTVASPIFSQDFTNSYHSNNFDNNIASYGNYYNWYSATAGNGTYNKSFGEVVGDVCPAGWTLPIGSGTDANGSFSHLDVAMGGTGSGQGTPEASNRWRSFPNNFVYSGRWYGSSVEHRGDSGYYWSSNAIVTNLAYGLSFGSSFVDPGMNNSNKYYGGSVRCVAQ